MEALLVDTYETLVRVTEELDVARDLLAGVRDYGQNVDTAFDDPYWASASRSA